MIPLAFTILFGLAAIYTAAFFLLYMIGYTITKIITKKRARRLTSSLDYEN